MSEKKTTKKKSKKEAANTAAKSEATSKAAKGTESSSQVKSNTIQNGKGSAPRNMGPRFKKNFGKIKWSGDSKKRQDGRREVKVYG